MSQCGILQCEPASWDFAQKIIGDPLAREEATKLIYETDAQGNIAWLDALLSFKPLISQQTMNGYKLASSPSKVFHGYRLAQEAGDKIRLASIKAPGEYTDFMCGYVDLLP